MTATRIVVLVAAGVVGAAGIVMIVIGALAAPAPAPGRAAAIVLIGGERVGPWRVCAEGVRAREGSWGQAGESCVVAWVGEPPTVGVAVVGTVCAAGAYAVITAERCEVPR